MTNVLRFPLHNISPEKISDLQEKYPNASVRIELNDTPAEGGLSESDFWRLIEQLDWAKTGDDDAVIEPVAAALSAGPLRHVYDFKDLLSQKLYLLDGEAFAKHIGEGSFDPASDEFSADGFLFSRCCAVANGERTFREILADPSKMPKDMEFAALLRIPNEAHRRAKGTALNYVAAYPVETFSNKKGWKSLSPTA